MEDVKTIISAESRLNACVLDALHAAGIEIVSPSFMNQRQVGETIFIPKKVQKAEKLKVDNSEAPENKIFDKADEAESLENRKERLTEVEAKIKACQEELTTAEGDEAKADIQKRLDRWSNVKEKMLEKIDEQSSEMQSGK